eukprot:SAG11_NODE_1329_length_5192_cov_3.608286_2_plen_169_part_00
MEVVKRPEAVCDRKSPSFGRADCRGVGGRRDSVRVEKQGSRANGQVSRCWSPRRHLRRIGGLPGAHRPQAASFLPSLVAGALLATAELKERHQVEGLLPTEGRDLDIEVLRLTAPDPFERMGAEVQRRAVVSLLLHRDLGLVKDRALVRLSAACVKHQLKVYLSKLRS